MKLGGHASGAQAINTKAKQSSFLGAAMTSPGLGSSQIPTTRLNHIRPSQSAMATEILTDTKNQQKVGTSSWVSKEARKGMFAHAKEVVNPVAARVVGTLPAWLEGELISNGAGYYQDMLHLFDGLAMVTKLSIKQGKVEGSQRFIETNQWKNVKRTGKLKWREFATELPSNSLMEKVGQVAENMLMLATNGAGTTDNASVNILPLADGTLLATSEAMTSQYRLDPKTLNTIGQFKPSDGFPGQLMTAHHKALPGGRKVVNFTHSIPGGGFHVHIQDLETLERKQIGYFPDANPLAPAWVHDFNITENHAIIVENPILFNMKNLVLGGSTEYLFMDWVPKQGTRVHVVKLDGTGARTLLAPPFFVFHHANAFEQDGQIHVDMGGYDGPKVLNDLSLGSMQTYPGENVSQSHLWRLSIPINAPTGTQLPAPRPVMPDSSQHGSFCEFPVVSPKVRSRPYRYAYSLAAKRPTNMGNALAKYDTQEGVCSLWHEPGCAPGEPTFIPAPDSQSEDDGVVIAPVMGSNGLSFLLVLDGKTWTELARAELPYALPYRFHGAWLPAKQ